MRYKPTKLTWGMIIIVILAVIAKIAYGIIAITKCNIQLNIIQLVIIACILINGILGFLWSISEHYFEAYFAWIFVTIIECAIIGGFYTIKPEVGLGVSIILTLLFSSAYCNAIKDNK